MRRGFLLGKFLPPHAGHLFLCNTASALVDELTVLVCTLDRDPIPGATRFGWMQEMLPCARVLHFDRVVPQEPSEHPDFWNIWKALCLEMHPEPIDTVFGSEPYVERLAAELGARPLILDPGRLAFPVSGSAIRSDPAANWAMIPPAVRPWFQRRICLFGPESTGKTTLTVALADRYRTLYVPEYGRVYDGLKRGAPWGAEDFERIAEVHRAVRRSVAAQAGPVLFEDTDPLLTQVWERMLTGSSAPWRVSDPADLYLLLDTDIPWRDDGTRYFGRKPEREAFRAACLSALEGTGVRFRLIRGSGLERLGNCVSAVEAFLKSTPSRGTA